MAVLARSLERNEALRISGGVDPLGVGVGLTDSPRALRLVVREGENAITIEGDAHGTSMRELGQVRGPQVASDDAESLGRTAVGLHRGCEHPGSSRRGLPGLARVEKGHGEPAVEAREADGTPDDAAANHPDGARRHGAETRRSCPS